MHRLVVACVLLLAVCGTEAKDASSSSSSATFFPPKDQGVQGERKWYFQAVLDHDHSGILTLEEMLDFACRYHFSESACGEPSKLLMSQLRTMFSLMDSDGSGDISYLEYSHATENRVGEPISGAPQQVHLAVTTKPSEMVVMWVTRDQLPSVVQFGLQPRTYTNTTTGTVTTYNVGVFGWSGWIHTVTLTGLQENTMYFYNCGSNNNWSDEFHFVTAPSSPDPAQRMAFAVVADMGTTIPLGFAVTNQVIADNQDDPFSLVLHAGDVCYAGTGSTYEFEEVWDVWGDQVQGIAAVVPYMFAVGNHEHYYNYTSFNTRFTMPGPQSGGVGNFWYSIDYGLVHFTFMSTEHPYGIGSPQYNWLQKDLAAANANRNNRPWVILLGHRPMYNTDTSEWPDHRPGGYFQRTIEPLMLQSHVDLYLCGHMHMYERVHPVNNGTVVENGNYYLNPAAPAHVIQATAGVFTDSSFIEPQPAWSAYRDNRYGYGKMVVHNSTHLQYTYLHLDTGHTIDEFWIQKK